MSLESNQNNLYPIVVSSTVGITIGTVCYLQQGGWGTPKGLLMSITNTPLYKKVIQTDHGFQPIAS